MADNKKEKVKEILKYCGCTESVSEEKSKKISTQGLEKMKEKDPCNTILINDAIHGPVVLNSLLKEIIDTPEFQRLRYIKQLGGGSYVYPGANHTRFDHSIGVYHIAGEFGRFLKNQLEDEQSDSIGTSITPKELLCLQIAGLCHDLGHGPFSHTFEHRVLHRMPMPDGVKLKHEEISLKLFDSIMKHPKVLVEFVYVYELGKDEVFLIKKMIHPKYLSKNDPILSEEILKKEFLYQIVANKKSGIDVDKWDYFTRDCHCLGIAMDFQWKNWTICMEWVAHEVLCIVKHVCIKLRKLSALNLDDCILGWLHDYLCNRLQAVIVDGEESESSSVLSGVPQGSVLGPMLFLIYINDLTSVVVHPNSTINMFADDVLLYHTISSSEDYLDAQQSITAIEHWSSNNYLQLNALKCKCMTISRKKKPIAPHCALVLNNSTLEQVQSYKYLGLLLTADLSWSSHISSIRLKARKILGLLYRRFYGNVSQDVLKQLYLSLVRPHLEYACQVWNPHLEKDKKAIENVQKFACKIATARWDDNYENLLELLNLQPLHERRTHARLGLLYRILYKLSYFPESTFKLRENTPQSRGSHQLELQVPFARTNSYLYSFVPQTTALWNSLPKDTINLSTSYHSFKYHLRSQ